jgi:hypothetical protein
MTTAHIDVDYRGHRITLEIHGGHALVLALDGVTRKRRCGDESIDCVYVWTNVELHWEEHHFIEGRWWPATGRLRLTANGAPLHDALIRSPGQS